MIRDNIKKYPMRAHGITTRSDSKGANLLGGIFYSTIYPCIYGSAFRIPLCITIREFVSNSAKLVSQGYLSGGGLCW